MTTDRTSLRANEEGAIMVMGIFMAVFLVGVLYFVLGIGETILFRERMQDAADAGAFGSAVVHARGMNFMALINCVMAVVLSVLVALKMIQYLTYIAIGIAMLLAWPTAGASMSVVPTLSNISVKVSQLYTKLQNPVYQVLRAGHKATKAISYSMPIAAQLKVLDTTTGAYSPPAIGGLAWPLYQQLPVQDWENCCKRCKSGKACGATCISENKACKAGRGCACDSSFDELCGRAGEYVGRVVSMPFDKLPEIPIIGTNISEEIQKFTRQKSKEFSRWFCGVGSAADFERKDKVSFPETKNGEKCRTTGDVAACTEAQGEWRDSAPDENTGECRDSTCKSRVKLARTQCKPADGKEISKWRWQEERTLLTIRKDDYGILHRKEEPMGGPQVGGPSNQPPCGKNGTIGNDWKARGNVCVDKDEPNGDWLYPGEETTKEIVVVKEILGCEGKVSMTMPDGDVPEIPDGGIGMEPAVVAPNTPLGTDTYQIRVGVIGNPGRVAFADRALQATTVLGNKNAGATYKAATELSRFALAQSEFFFDGGEERMEWLWHMRWKGRLRRFRIGIDTVAKMHEACAAKPSAVCTGMDKVIDFLDNISLH